MAKQLENKKLNYGLIMTVYLLGIFMGALDTGIVTPARTVIQESLGVSDTAGIWMITIYTLAYAASIPVMGKLADRLGRRSVYLVSIALFGGGSLLCGLSHSFDSFAFLLGARAIQAIGGGGIVPKVPVSTVENSYPPDIKFPTLYLCHGGSCCCSSYIRETNIERYADDKMLMTVSCELEESFASDMVYGRKYFTFLTEEVPALVQSWFPSSTKREDNFIAGFSMGAHSALKAALRCPEKYAAVWAMSGAKDIVKMRKLAAEIGFTNGDPEFWAFGSRTPEDMLGTENDLLHLAAELGKTSKPRPMIVTSCGTLDYGMEYCIEMHNHLTSCGLDNTFIKAEGHVHDYEYVDAMFKKLVYEVFPINVPDIPGAE